MATYRSKFILFIILPVHQLGAFVPADGATPEHNVNSFCLCRPPVYSNCCLVPWSAVPTMSTSYSTRIEEAQYTCSKHGLCFNVYTKKLKNSQYRLRPPLLGGPIKRRAGLYHIYRNVKVALVKNYSEFHRLSFY